MYQLIKFVVQEKLFVVLDLFKKTIHHTAAFLHFLFVKLLVEVFVVRRFRVDVQANN